MEGRHSIEARTEPKSVILATDDSERSSDVDQVNEVPPPPEREYPDTLHLAFATVAFMAAFFLVALDVHILGMW